jgi:hypothetical protein
MNESINLYFNCVDQTRPSWFDRADKCVDLIKEVFPEGRRLVITDLGCGDKKLAACMANRGLDIDYRPYDLMPQSPDVHPLDLRTQMPASGSDVVTMLGVAEYLDDLASVLQRLSGVTNYLVVSYTPSDFSSYSDERLDALGWKHHLSQATFEELLAQVGLHIRKRKFTANRRILLWLCATSGKLSA